jgi:putative membrane protein
MMWWPYGYGPGGTWMVLGWVTMLLFWGLVVVGAVALVRYASARAASPRVESPLEILRRRYAAGELTREQFDQMARDITAGAGRGAA